MVTFFGFPISKHEIKLFQYKIQQVFLKKNVLLFTLKYSLHFFHFSLPKQRIEINSSVKATKLIFPQEKKRKSFPSQVWAFFGEKFNKEREDVLATFPTDVAEIIVSWLRSGRCEW